MMSHHYRIVSSVLIPEGDRYWFVKTKDGLWGLPGGRARARENEFIAHTARRETEEELGVGVDLQSIVGIYQYSNHQHPVINFCFRGRIVRGNPEVPSNQTEIVEVRQFDYAGLNGLNHDKLLRTGDTILSIIDRYRKGNYCPLNIFPI